MPTQTWRFLIDENLPARLAGQLRAEGYEAEHAYYAGLRNHIDPDVFAYARRVGATLITQDHDLERDTGQFPPPHPASYSWSCHRSGREMIGYCALVRPCAASGDNHCKMLW